MSSDSAVATRDREQVILEHMPLVRLLALCIHRRCPPEVLLDDLVSAGTVGLIQAVDRYEPGRNLKLRTLAGHRIRGAILDHLRQLDPLTRSLRRFQRHRYDVKIRLQGLLGRAPSESELAAELGLAIEKYRKLARVVQSASVVSLEWLSSAHVQHPQIADASRRRSEAVDLTDPLRAMIARLPGRERIVVIGLQRGLTLREIGQELRLSESRVSQLKARAIARLRHAVRANAGFASKLGAG